jgi:hypothetical protein
MEKNNYKKYFSIKVGCSDCLGTPLEINMQDSPENRIKDLTDFHRIDYLPAGEYSCYVLTKKEGNEALFQMALDSDGDIRITSNNSHAITINPIDEGRAKDLVDRINEHRNPHWEPS